MSCNVSVNRATETMAGKRDHTRQHATCNRDTDTMAGKHHHTRQHDCFSCDDDDMRSFKDDDNLSSTTISDLSHTITMIITVIEGERKWQQSRHH